MMTLPGRVPEQRSGEALRDRFLGSTVLAYHAIGDVPRHQDVHSLFTPVAVFRAQMERLAAGRRVVPLDALVDGRVRGRGHVAITFDDGYRNVLEHGLPILQRLGLPATMFVPSKHIGDANRWDADTGLPLGIMTADELREADRGGLRVESHGHAHLDMRVVPPEEAEADLRRSREVLADVTGRAPEHLAWPYRVGAEEAQAAAARLGFRAAFSIDLPSAGRMAWGRVQVAPGDGRAVFAAKCSGAYLRLRYDPWLDAGYRRLVRPLVRRG